FRLAVRRAAVVLVLNDQSKNYVSALSNKPVVKIPNFIDENILLKTEKVVSSCIRKVVFVGHAQKAKGYFEIAEVAERMPHIEFRIVGALHQECLSRSCPSNIIVVGDVSRDRVIDELDAADVFLFPSHTEGFANALTEAMARGLPVVTTNVGANYDMIEDKGGIVVPVNDSGAIVKALNHLEDPAIRAYMSVWNVEKVRNFYLIDKVVDQLLNVYRETAS
ncbi:MAG: glycosyltransferase family 4 protein, partial [Bacteroides sp.]